MRDFCVGTYLTTRLEQLGVRHLFSVPGDYTSELLAIVDQASGLTRVGNCNELNAGYAADGYARQRGLGAVAVTSGVGAFSLVNAIAGSFAERVPVVLIVGTLSNQSRLLEINAGRLFHHQVSVTDKDHEILRNVTVAQERITNPLMAPEQIDRALRECISRHAPVLIEITEDCYRLPCAPPHGAIVPVPAYTPYPELASLSPDNKHAARVVAAIDKAADAVYEKLRAAQAPVFWFGHELAIHGQRDRAYKLLALTGAPFVTSLRGKSVLAETTRGYAGIYEGAFTSPYTAELTSRSDCVIALGVWNTDVNFLGTRTNQPANPTPVFASRDMVRVGLDIYVQVSLENLLTALIERIETRGYSPSTRELARPPRPPEPAAGPITYNGFFSMLNGFLRPEHLVVADIGISACGASAFLDIPRQDGYTIQAVWGSIGWSVPAGLGASFSDEIRAVVVVGDGAFKLTCQELATMVRCGRNTVVFVMNNGVYAIEQMLLDTAPFQAPPRGPFEDANVLQRWDYVSLMRGLANGDEARGRGVKVTTVSDLQEALRQIDEHRDTCWLVDVHLDERDYPSAWSALVGPKDP